MNPIGPADLLRRRVTEDPSRPLITFYDDASGERVELSARTFDNWVAKTANFLVDGLAAEPGTRVVLALPPHWQTAVWLMACWSAGMVAVPRDIRGEARNAGAAVAGGSGGSPPQKETDIGSGGAEPIGAPGPYVLVSAEEVLDRMHTDRDAEEIVGLSLHSLGRGLAEVPAGVVDYAVEVRGYGDRFVPGPEVTPEGPALSVTKATFTGTGLVDAAHEAAGRWGLDAQDRVLVDMPYTTLDGVLAGLLAPLASGASVIIQRNFIKSSLDRRVTVEHVTAVAGVPGWIDASGSSRRLL